MWGRQDEPNLLCPWQDLQDGNTLSPLVHSLLQEHRFCSQELQLEHLWFPPSSTNPAKLEKGVFYSFCSFGHRTLCRSKGNIVDSHRVHISHLEIFLCCNRPVWRRFHPRRSNSLARCVELVKWSKTELRAHNIKHTFLINRARAVYLVYDRQDRAQWMWHFRVSSPRLLKRKMNMTRRKYEPFCFLCTWWLSKIIYSAEFSCCFFSPNFLVAFSKTFEDNALADLQRFHLTFFPPYKFQMSATAASSHTRSCVGARVVWSLFWDKTKCCTVVTHLADQSESPARFCRTWVVP